MLTVGNANLLLAHGSDEQIDAFVRPMIEGRFHGTMASPSRRPARRWPTSPPAPNREDTDGTYRLFGVEDVDLRRRSRA